MKRLLLVAVTLVLTGCSAAAPVDPLVRCIDVSMEYGLVADREEAAEVCQFVAENEGMLGGSTFDETFGSADTATAWAKSELAKTR